VAKRFLGGVPALVLTGITFASGSREHSSLLPLLTLAYETTGSLWVSMTMHAAFNAVNLVISYPNFSRQGGRKCSTAAIERAKIGDVI
jgi:membrane protease YdiL (CAAX protease family)